MRAWGKWLAAATVGIALLSQVAGLGAAISTTDKVSDVRGTKHNLSAAADGSATPSGGKVPVRAIKASSETQVCVFCHTPHQATSGLAPLWNRAQSEATNYTTYDSGSMEAAASELAAAPGGASKLCLSCHDGTMGIDKVNVLNGLANATIAMSGQTKMPATNATTGFTRNLGVNLASDHPISFTYDSTLATNDGELRTPGGSIVASRVSGGTPPKLPLDNGKMQCTTCHDPHLRDKVTANGNAKFLRANRFQVTQPGGTSYSATNDIICLACHDKGGVSYAYSAHANQQVATQTYKPAAAQQREFPSSSDVPANDNPPVWQVSCLNCHDTHSVQGARRLLREGTDNTSTPKAGGNSAIEETCFQCHNTTGASAVTYTAQTATAIPDIASDYVTTNKRMPLRSTEQRAGSEVHDIGGTFNDGVDANCSKTTGKCGKDLLESKARLGHGNLNNRHAECSDCHNPHRVVKFQDFRGKPAGSITGTPDGSGTHKHTDDVNTNHSNIASGVLRGSWGVEPKFGSTSFHAMPSGFDVKKGDPGSSTSALVTDTYVTREYQICLKCHSNYGFADNNVYPNGTRPTLGSPGTASGTMGLTVYTNIAKEVQAPTTMMGPANSNTCINQGTNAGANSAFNNCNHRSWHPVMDKTDRSLTTRRITTNSWRAPWSNQVGSNTMYCSDCHGSNTAATTVIPTNGENGSPWGPHGSANDFILKGAWTDATGATTNFLCFKCHDSAAYNGTSDSGRTSGFYDGAGSRGNLHNYHRSKLGKALRCTWCHVAIPHGWKNKSLLVNLNDVGEEAGEGANSSKEVSINHTGDCCGPGKGAGNFYTKEPYYYKAVLKIRTFNVSGAWLPGSCGSVNKTGGNLIANSQNTTNNNTSTGRNWMEQTCYNPP